jgi:hypothetical protein
MPMNGSKCTDFEEKKIYGNNELKFLMFLYNTIIDIIINTPLNSA